MIKKLKRKFTLLATASMFVLMTVIILIINTVNFSSLISECDETLDMLSKKEAISFSGNAMVDIPEFDFMPKGMSPEVPYESRYFTVVVKEDGTIVDPDFSKIISINNDSAKEYIIKAIAKGKDHGFVKDFRYLKTVNGDETKILFLDCGRKMDQYRTFLWSSISAAIFGCLIVFLSFMFFSERIVRPIAESYEKQKRFISDASHEIKTPLTIINANIDLLEGDEEIEELVEIRNQTARLTELTNNLVYLSKMEESGDSLQKISMSLSDVVADAASPFKTVASASNISLNMNIAPDVTIKAAPDAIKQLISILLENAIKYSPVEGTATLSVEANKKSATIKVSNNVKEKIEPESLKHVFDRFYRTDSSRNSETGGHGIGLSIAKTIVDAHGGNIVATSKEGNDFCITVTLPQ